MRFVACTLSHTFQITTKHFVVVVVVVAVTLSISSLSASLQSAHATNVIWLMHSHLRLAMYRFTARRVCLLHGTAFFPSSSSCGCVYECIKQRKGNKTDKNEDFVCITNQENNSENCPHTQTVVHTRCNSPLLLFGCSFFWLFDIKCNRCAYAVFNEI